jgi:NADH-quinone oxidoreductase subunit M
MIPLLMIVIPLVAAGLIAVTPSRFDVLQRTTALFGSLGSLLLGAVLWGMYPPGYGGYLEGYWTALQWQWFPRPLGATFHLGVDGIGLIFGLLSALLTVLVVLFSWRRITEKTRGYYTCVMLVSAAMLGIFFARDLLVFYLFWEAVLIPMYFLVGIWGGERRIYASMKFVLFTLSGSLLMLVAIVSLFWLNLAATGTPSMAIADFYGLSIDSSTAFWLFAGFSLAFAIKTPLFPVHTWLPDAHVEAPSAGSVILAGILLKVGIYGFIRLLIPIFPQQAIAWAGFLAFLGVVGIIYGGLVAWVQEDVKKLVAYSSISHLGFVVLGLFALNTTSVTGGLLQGAIHGVNTGALFLMVGMLYSRTHTRDIDSIGGLADQLPVYSTLFCVFAFASIGLPSTNGFVGEFLILSSSFGRFPWLTVVATGGVIVSALYMLYLLRACVFSDRTETVESLSDLNSLEIVTLLPLLILVFWVGLYPSPVIDRLEPTVQGLMVNEGPSHYLGESEMEKGEQSP